MFSNIQIVYSLKYKNCIRKIMKFVEEEKKNYFYTEKYFIINTATINNKMCQFL